MTPQKSETPKTIKKKRKITEMTEQQAGIKTEGRAMIEEEDEDLTKQKTTD
jgi:phage portal protein BeeE